jgi:peptidoglycan/LPS O-acetylase OafA/YrhL
VDGSCRKIRECRGGALSGVAFLGRRIPDESGAVVESKNQRYEPGLDHIRAFAASWIVVYHAFQLISAKLIHDAPFDPDQDWVISSNPLSALITEGHTAVGLFMVLSGFVLARAAIGSEVNYWRFIQNRLLRIYPMFIAIVLAGVALTGGTVSLDAMLMTLIPLGSVHAMANLGPFANSLWAVSVEFQFYLLFPFLMVFLARRGPRQLWLIILAAIVLRALVFGSGGDMRYVPYFTIIGRIDEFLLGILAAHFAASRRLVSPWLMIPMLAVCVGVLFAYNQGHGYVSSAPWKLIWPTAQGAMWAAFIVIYLSVCRYMPASVSRLLSALGTISFSMYLVHFIVVSIVVAFVGSRMAVGNDPHLLALTIGLVVVLPVTIVISRLTYAAIESPFLDLRVRYLAPCSSAVTTNTRKTTSASTRSTT